jgi:hypothetical protein
MPDVATTQLTPESGFWRLARSGFDRGRQLVRRGAFASRRSRTGPRMCSSSARSDAVSRLDAELVVRNAAFVRHPRSVTSSTTSLLARVVAQDVLEVRSKIEPWPASRSACCFCPQPSACSSTSSMPRRVRRSSRGAALDERLEHALVDDRGSTRSQKSQIDSNGPPSRARDDRLDAPTPDALDGVQAEADLALDDGEVDLRLVDVGRQHLDAHLVARVDVERHLVLRVHHRAEISAAMYSHRVVRLAARRCGRRSARSRRRGLLNE